MRLCIASVSVNLMSMLDERWHSNLHIKEPSYPANKKCLIERKATSNASVEYWIGCLRNRITAEFFGLWGVLVVEAAQTGGARINS